MQWKEVYLWCYCLQFLVGLFLWQLLSRPSIFTWLWTGNKTHGGSMKVLIWAQAHGYNFWLLGFLFFIYSLLLASNIFWSPCLLRTCPRLWKIVSLRSIRQLHLVQPRMQVQLMKLSNNCKIITMQKQLKNKESLFKK